MQNKINWKNLIGLSIFHVGAIIAIVCFPSRHRVLLAAIVWTVSLCPGIGAGWHRLLTHKAYVCSKRLERVLTICGYLALQGGAIFWVAVHRRHHQVTDKPGDPHSPRDGSWWAHIMWLIFMDPGLKNPVFLRKYAPDLCKDKFHLVMDRLALLPLALLGVTVMLVSSLRAGIVSGIEDMCWAVFVPAAIGLHCTWLVNSGTHMWGSQPHNTGDDSRNNWWIALISFGEGWHNNHHMFPRSPRHGLKWNQFDPNWGFIWMLSLLRLIKLDKRLIPD